MNYLSLDIRVGYSVFKSIGASRLKFHENAAHLLVPHESYYNRLGLQHTSAIDHRKYVHEPGAIKSIVTAALKEAVKFGVCDLCLIDFTSNPFVLIREPLLLALISCITDSCKSKLCNNFALLIPELPGQSSASIRQLDSLKSEISLEPFSVIVVANSGRNTVHSSNKVELSDFLPEYAACVKELYGTPAARLERKCVRRLGHFQSYDPKEGIRRCRRYSYQLFECEDELGALFEEWWGKNSHNGKSILFDLATNADFRNVIRAFGEKHSLVVERISDVLEHDGVRERVRALGESILVLDVVDSGVTLMRYAERLRELGIAVSEDVLTAINKRAEIGRAHV